MQRLHLIINIFSNKWSTNQEIKVLYKAFTF